MGETTNETVAHIWCELCPFGLEDSDWSLEELKQYLRSFLAILGE